MKVISAEALAKIANYGAIVEALREGFKADIATPVRHHHETSPVTTLLLMPAWSREWTGLMVTTTVGASAAADPAQNPANTRPSQRPRCIVFRPMTLCLKDDITLHI